MYKCGVHLALSFALLVGAGTLFGYSRNQAILRAIDSVQLTSWSKRSIDINKAVAFMKDAPVLDDDPAGCRTMIDKWWFPRVVFTNKSITPGCNIRFETSFQLSSNGKDYLSSVKATILEPVPTNCAPGLYPLSLDKGTNNNVNTLILDTALNVTATATEGVTVPVITNDGAFGGDWSANGTQWRHCAQQRSNLAKWANGNMSCTTEASQMCTCVYAFTNQLSDFTVNIPGPDNVTAATLLREAFDTCHKWRRAHDDRSNNGEPASMSYSLFVFAFALFMNNLYSTLIKWFPMLVTTYGGHFGSQVAYWVITCVIVGTTTQSGTNGAVYPMLLMLLPTLAIGLYFEFTIATQKAYHRPYLLPYTFDFLLSSLVTFTMLARGVTQFEHLAMELIKCHVVTMLYTAVVWYYIYYHHGDKRDDAQAGSDLKERTKIILGDPSVQDAFVMIIAAAVGLSCDALVVPYPSLQCFSIHFLLPPLFTLVAFLGLAWLSLLNLTHTVKAVSGDKILAYYQDITAYLVFFVGAVMFGLFLKQHMMIYSSTRPDAFPYIEDIVGANPLPAFIRPVKLL